MKKLLFILITVALMCSCSSGPKGAAQSFSENLAKGKVDEAKKYATESTGKMLDFASSMGGGGSKVNPDFKFIFVKDSISDNRAWVTFKGAEDEKEQTLELVKIDGDWKVNVDMKK
ncbi:DUF4878 domain-containing protein [Dysgonomonas sp. 521]|uniref:DUF4878 domain-containing protein n=1 Tax=Dysgonomonas sp. 521 TaxID=2302932 RepID=UPI0013D4F899|nr:DUF4878 domain-containing protein [Dysgonomonas sp. 521]NDV93793.1 DUF4878 domain-containing protein [Dysgonomonas sp. 521]